MVAVAIVAGAGGAGCTPPRTAAGAHGEIQEALTEAGRAQGCAAELSRAADVDPEATAELIAVEPAALAPWGGALHGKQAIREVILARAASALSDARAAHSLALLGEYASSEQEALRREKLARSLVVSSALCVAADVARNRQLAQRP
jgi:hypothetical protein